MLLPKNKMRPLQAALKDLGVYDGKIDGIPGPKTIAAFQKIEDILLQKPEEEKDLPTVEPLPSPDLDGPGADFGDAFDYTLKDEGGYVNHPNDRGGPTNKGITLKTLSTYLGRKATSTDVKNLKNETIRDIYKKKYWDVLNLDKVIDNKIATPIFNIGVLCGPGTVAKYVQEIVGVSQDGKFGPVTLDAINTMDNGVFVPRLCDRLQKRFDEIVRDNPSQKVFANGWRNRANRLREFAIDDGPVITLPVPEDVNDIGSGLYDLASNTGLVTTDDIKRLIDFQKQNSPNSNPRYWAVFKIKEHSGKKRLFIFDRKENKVKSYYSTHGEGSDKDNNGLAEKFSNEDGSHCSALGIYKTLSTYQSTKFGRALRLEGMEETNSKAKARAIVWHKAGYAAPEYVEKNGKAGRSWGCVCFSANDITTTIDQMIGGSLLLLS